MSVTLIGIDRLGFKPCRYFTVSYGSRKVRLLDKKQTYEKLGIGRSQFDEMVRNGDFPPPKYLPNCSKKLWPDTVVDEWLLMNLKDEKPADVTS